ncbi:MAG: hypothetical protein PVH21_10440 [Myxococcales bacterium]|jgi:hypothetical protein
MVDVIGYCEKHELPLDDDGECELCRLSGMPSKPPPVRSGFLAIVIPIALVLVGAMWLLSSYTAYPQGVPERGVPQHETH